MTTVHIGDLYTVSNGLSKGKVFFGKGYPFLTFSEVMNNFFVPDELTSLVQTEEQERQRFSIQRGDVFLNRTSETADELGVSCVALKDYPNATFNGFCKRLRLISDDVIPEYMGYYLRTHAFRKHMSALTGSMTTRASLRNEQLLSIELELPSKEAQIKVANILRQYDILINNCKKQIALLEEAAQRLYREWFVDLRFPGHETTPIGENDLPEGWIYTILADIADIVMGQSPASTYYNNDKIGLPFHQGVSSFGNIYVINDIYTSKWTKEAVPNSILFSVRAPVGRINLTSERVALGRGVASINHKGELQPFLYHFLKYYFYKDNIMGNGTIFSSINKEQLKGVKILAPSEHIATSFCKLVSAYDRQLSVIDSKLKFLIEARDTFLPRLISGQIEINA